MQFSGGAVSAHMKRLQKAGWKPALTAEPAPQATAEEEEIDEHDLGYLVLWYDRLRGQTRPVDGEHVRLEYLAIQAFLGLYRLDADPFDIDTLEKLDRLWLKCLPKRPPPTTRR